MLTKDLNVTPKQATGGAGALFGLAKSRLKPDQFSQVAAAVPGMDGLLKAAPSAGGLPGWEAPFQARRAAWPLPLRLSKSLASHLTWSVNSCLCLRNL